MHEEIEEAEDGASIPMDYVRRGIYHEQLRRYLDNFPREQFLIIDPAELLTDRLATMNSACRFLGIEPFEHEEAWPLVNVGAYESEMSAAARNFLAEFYAPHNEALFELIGREFDWTRPAVTPRLARMAG